MSLLISLKIASNDIISNDGREASFRFLTPGVPSPSIEFDAPPFDVDFSLDFDSLISLPNLIKFHYIPDVVLNFSPTLPTLSYRGEELKLRVENLTEAASKDDIKLLIGCTECQLKTFTPKGITCQPPARLLTNVPLFLNYHQDQGWFFCFC